MTSIGVGVTTHNRPEIFSHTLSQLRDLTPEAKIVVVDDASERRAAEGPTFRFENRVGVARAKNKCLELLEDCDHIFLFDDDCYPLKKDWWQPYVESSEPHLMYLFSHWSNGKPVGDSEITFEDDSLVAHSHERGCMIYVDRTVLEAVGGMDPAFGLWGGEHGDWSNRIHAASLTTHPYMDVAGSSELIYSMDEHQEVASSVKRRDRRPDTDLVESRRGRVIYSDYREGQNVVLTSLLLKAGDPQRPRKRQPTRVRAKTPWTVVLTDENVETRGISPYLERWFIQRDWLEAHPEIDWIWCVDATDVQMLREPWREMKPGVLYIGSEHVITDNGWLREKHPAARYLQCFEEFADEPLLNCGIVGGDSETVLAFLTDMTTEIELAMKTNPEIELEMGAFNYVVRTRWNDRFFTGPKVHTVFKAKRDNGCAWWQHK